MRLIVYPSSQEIPHPIPAWKSPTCSSSPNSSLVCFVVQHPWEMSTSFPPTLAPGLIVHIPLRSQALRVVLVLLLASALHTLGWTRVALATALSVQLALIALALQALRVVFILFLARPAARAPLRAIVSLATALAVVGLEGLVGRHGAVRLRRAGAGRLGLLACHAEGGGGQEEGGDGGETHGDGCWFVVSGSLNYFVVRARDLVKITLDRLFKDIEAVYKKGNPFKPRL